MVSTTLPEALTSKPRNATDYPAQRPAACATSCPPPPPPPPPPPTCSLALAALFFAFVPWGFASFLNGDGSSGSTIGGAGGEQVW